MYVHTLAFKSIVQSMAGETSIAKRNSNRLRSVVKAALWFLQVRRLVRSADRPGDGPRVLCAGIPAENSRKVLESGYGGLKSETQTKESYLTSAAIHTSYAILNAMDFSACR